MSLCVVVKGNPADGYNVIGPFKQEYYAVDWAQEWLPDVDWWVMPLESIEEYQDGRTDQESR